MKDFAEALDAIAHSVDEVKTSALTDATKKLVAESSLLAAAVLWEGFITDLFVAHINRDSIQLSSTLKKRIEQSVEQKFGSHVLQRVKVSFPDHLPEREVRSLLDPTNYNLSFESASKMIERADKSLPASVAGKFRALSPADCAAINAWHDIRNFLAHRSGSSKKEMNDTLTKPDLQNDLRRNMHKVHSAGAFLKATPMGTQKWRVEHYFDAMKTIAQKL